MKKLLHLAIAVIFCSVNAAYAATQPVLDMAEDIGTDTSNFDKNLSGSDDDVQKALDTLDDADLTQDDLSDNSINDLFDVNTSGWAQGKLLKFDASGNLIVGDDSDTTYSAGTGLDLTGTTFSLSHLGLENLTDPNANRIYYWNDTNDITEWLDYSGWDTDASDDFSGSWNDLTDIPAGFADGVDDVDDADADVTNELQNIFQKITDGTNTATADGTTDTFTLTAGSGISITVDATNDKATIANTGDTDASDDLTTSTIFDGDIAGTYNAIVVTDDSHSHTSATLPADTTFLGSTIEKEEISDATSTPTASKIPISDASGKLDGWITLGSSIEDGEIPDTITRDTEWDTETELENHLTDVTNVFTNNDTIDISDNTNLTAGTNITLSNDTLNVNDAFLTNNASDSMVVSGDACLTIHSNTDSPTSNAKMLILKTGSTSPTEKFVIDEDGEVVTGIWTGSEIADAYISNTITVGASGSVDDGAIPAGITRDTEWDTIAEIEAATGVDIITSTENNDSADDLSDNTTDDLSEGATNLYHTDERAQDAVGTILTDTNTINLTYDDATPKITADLNSTLKSNYDAAYSHISSDGTSHTYINQDLRTTATPQFAKLGIGTSPSYELEINGNLYFSKGADRTIAIETATAGGDTLTIRAGHAGDGDGGDLKLAGGDEAKGGAGGNVYLYGGAGESAPDDGNVVLAHTGAETRGNVGIKTNQPAYDLDIRGDAQLNLGDINEQDPAAKIYLRGGGGSYVTIENDEGVLKLSETSVNTNLTTPKLTIGSYYISSLAGNNKISNASLADKLYAHNWRDNDLTPQAIGYRRIAAGFGNLGYGGYYCDWIGFNTWSDTSGGYSNLLAFRKRSSTGDADFEVRLYKQAANSTSQYSAYKNVVLRDAGTAGYIPQWHTVQGQLTNSALNSTRVGWINGVITASQTVIATARLNIPQEDTPANNGDLSMYSATGGAGLYFKYNGSVYCVYPSVGAECPFVYDLKGNPITNILFDSERKYTKCFNLLYNYDGEMKFIIKEIEDEVTFIDYIALGIRYTKNGITWEREIPLQHPILGKEDKRYIRMEKGDELKIEFDIPYEVVDGDTKIEYGIIAAGYYERTEDPLGNWKRLREINNENTVH